jgi:hypothetical protein
VADVDVSLKFDLFLRVQGAIVCLGGKFLDPSEISARESNFKEVTGELGRDPSCVGNKNSLPDRQLGIGNVRGLLHVLIVPNAGLLSTAEVVWPVQDDDHLLTVLRYVERNLLRANLVKQAEQ